MGTPELVSVAAVVTTAMIAVIPVTAVVVIATVTAAMVFIAAAGFIAAEMMVMTIAMELAMLAVMWKLATVSMPRVITIIYMPVPTMAAMVPGARSDKEAVRKPLWTVVTVGGAIVRGVIEVAVGTDRGLLPDADAERYLGFCR